MKIYNYHPDHNYYLGSSDADPSPLEPGVFLIPAHATELEPPSYSSCEIPVFNGTSWDIIENCCGTYYFIPSGKSIEHNNPLEPPENATKQKPPEVPEGFYLEWNDKWELKESHCGTYYSTETGEEIQHQNPLEPPENATKEQPPEIPEGFYLEWNDQWELKEIPIPEPLTPQQKLEQAGLTVEELKELLGL